MSYVRTRNPVARTFLRIRGRARTRPRPESGGGADGAASGPLRPRAVRSPYGTPHNACPHCSPAGRWRVVHARCGCGCSLEQSAARQASDNATRKVHEFRAAAARLPPPYPTSRRSIPRPLRPRWKACASTTRIRSRTLRGTIETPAWLAHHRCGRSGLAVDPLPGPHRSHEGRQPLSASRRRPHTARLIRRARVEWPSWDSLSRSSIYPRRTTRRPPRLSMGLRPPDAGALDTHVVAVVADRSRTSCDGRRTGTSGVAVRDMPAACSRWLGVATTRAVRSQVRPLPSLHACQIPHSAACHACHACRGRSPRAPLCAPLVDRRGGRNPELLTPRISPELPGWRAATNHILHLILTLQTLGLWVSLASTSTATRTSRSRPTPRGHHHGHFGST